MKSKKLKLIQHRVEYILLLLICRIVWKMPLASVLKLADAFGTITFRFVKIRRRVTEENLRMAFPEKSEAEIGKIALGAYRHMARTSFELVHSPVKKRKRCSGASGS